MAKRRVVVTGMGIISPVGTGSATAWQNILACRSGIAAITRFDAAAFTSRIAGEVKGFDVTKYLSGKEARRYDTFIHYGLVATMEAVKDAGLEAYTGDLTRVGVCIGSGIGGLPMIEDTAKAYFEGGPRKISPFFVPGSIINMISGLVSIHYGYQGPNLATVTACSTANHSFGEAARLIEYGDADAMVAGGAEATVSPLGIGGFCAARALSTRNDDPATASRPWDVDRDGFVLGEGAGILVLEALEHAKARRRPSKRSSRCLLCATRSHRPRPICSTRIRAATSISLPTQHAACRCAPHCLTPSASAGPTRPSRSARCDSRSGHARMALIVQKYGGTSVGSTDRIRSVARRVARFHREGHQLVVVVSAMSGETNRLLALAKEIAPDPDPRELDVIAATGEQVTIGLLAIALHEL